MQAWRQRQSVLINQESQSVVDREAVLATIREHITHNIIKVDGRYLRTRTGIPQGSVLSVLLCGLFYAHLENQVLRPRVCPPKENFNCPWMSNPVLGAPLSQSRTPTLATQQPTIHGLTTPERCKPTQFSLLLRLVDNFLFISTNETSAKDFVSVLHDSVPEYGCNVSVAKTQSQLQHARK